MPVGYGTRDGVLAMATLALGVVRGIIVYQASGKAYRRRALRGRGRIGPADGFIC